MGVDQYFIQLYFILSLVGTLSAMIMSRIWPLEGKWKDEYYPPVGRKVQEVHPVGISRSRWALHQAIKRAEKGPTFFQLVSNGIQLFLNIISHWYQLPCASEHWPAVCHPILHSSNGLPCRFSGISNSVVWKNMQPQLPGLLSVCWYVHSCHDLCRNHFHEDTVCHLYPFFSPNHLYDRSRFHYAKFQVAHNHHGSCYHFLEKQSLPFPWLFSSLIYL